MLKFRAMSSGFTLVEVLVALVITSMLVSILMGSLYYMYRVQESLRAEIIVREADLRSKEWFYEVLAACLPAENGSGSEFIGTEKEIMCDSASPLRPQLVVAPQRVFVGLRRGASGETEVTYHEGGGEGRRTRVIALLPEGNFRFLYSNDQGREVERWPLSAKDPQTLPRRIRLIIETRSSGKIDWLVSVRADPWLEELFQNPFGIKVEK